MKRVREVLLLSIGVSLLALGSCDVSDDFVEPIDFDMQYQEDLTEIMDYLADRGITNADTTDNGVWFVVLDSGDGDTIEVNDFVQIDYFATFSTGGGVVSSIQFVTDTAANISINSPTLQFTHTETGWAFTQAAVIGFDGLTDGITALLNQEDPRLLVGGHGLIAIPRREIINTGPSGFPQAVSGFPNAVLIYEFFPQNVRK